MARMLVYAGPAITYEDADLATDWAGLLGLNMQFRDNWGFELNLLAGRSKDEGEAYAYYEASGSSWFNTSPRWNGNLWGGYSHGYNFSREYVGFFSWGGFSMQWKAAPFLDIGTSFDTYVEGRPDNVIEDVTYNARPVLGFSPFNDMRLRVYVDNVFVQSADRLESVILGVLFSYNFLPKSWIYIALNELRERASEDERNPARMRVADRVGVVKVKYLYLF